MKVFISWSGPRSKDFANFLKGWLKTILQRLDPWVSSEDIGAGDDWWRELRDSLNDLHCGIVCLTPDNLSAPYLLFEAGALSKHTAKGKVAGILLFGLTTPDIPDGNPFSKFQNSMPEKPPMLKLIKDLNEQLGEEKLDPETLGDAFSAQWPRYEEKYQELAGQYESDGKPPEERRNPETMLEDLIAMGRRQETLLSKIYQEQRKEGTIHIEPARFISQQGLGKIITTPGTWVATGHPPSLTIGERPMSEHGHEASDVGGEPSPDSAEPPENKS